MLLRRLALVALLGPVAAQAAAPPADLLAQRMPSQSRGVSRPGLLTDGLAVPEGDVWLSQRTSRLRTSGSWVVWDLGRRQSLGCWWIQADANDEYRLEVSDDGREFRPLGQVAATPGPGIRQRHRPVAGAGRYLRLRARGGDGFYAVAETALYSACPDHLGLDRPRRAGRSTLDSARWALLATGFLFAAALCLRRGSPWSRRLFWLGVGLASAWMVRELAHLYPLHETYGQARSSESLLRATVAALGALVAGLELRRAEPVPRRQPLALAGLALVALGCFWHFGAPQFRHAAQDRPTRVHTFDLRHYAPFAKYFDELRYDGLYSASLGAYLEITGTGLQSLHQVAIRDLTTSQMRWAPALGPEVAAARARFTAERWQAFVADAGSILEIMGPAAYLGSLRDHGGNAPPVWAFMARRLLGDAPLSEDRLRRLGWLDPLLLTLMFGTLLRTFGLRITCYLALLFGASDFYQFGTSFAGSWLRQDWLVACALGLCALHRRRSVLGGGLLAYAALVRAFPLVALVAVGGSLAWYGLVGRQGSPGAHPRGRSLVATLGGAAGVAILLVGLTTLDLGPRVWDDWRAKISVHQSDPSVNSVGWRTLAAYDPATTARRMLRGGHPEPWIDWQAAFHANLERRRWLYRAVPVAWMVLILLALRSAPPATAALLGLATVPWVFYLSNYYLHFVFLLPLLPWTGAPPGSRDRRFLVAVMLVAGLSVVQYLTLGEPWADECYTGQSVGLLVCLSGVVGTLMWRRRSAPSIASVDSNPASNLPSG